MGEDESQELIQPFYIRQTTLDDSIYVSFLPSSQKCLHLKKIFFLLKNTNEKKNKFS